MVILIFAALFLVMGLSHFFNAGWFRWKSLGSVITAENIPVYRRRVGVAFLLLSLAFLSYWRFHYSLWLYTLFACAPAALILFANRKYGGKWFL